MKMQTIELAGAGLDWAVTLALGADCSGPRYPLYSTDWACSGPIIEQESISINLHGAPLAGWVASRGRTHAHGPTPLVAALRCYVQSKLGPEVDIPEDLKD